MRARSSASLVALVLASVSLLAPVARAHWPTGGIPVTTSDSAKFTPCAVPDGAGGAFIAWIEESGLDRLVHAQHLTSDGSVAAGWPSEGVLVSASVGFYGGLTMVADGDGGAYVAWDTDYIYGGIALAHVGANTAVLNAWSIENSASPIAPPGGVGRPGPEKHESGNSLPALVPVEGGVIMVWLYATQLYGNLIGVQRFGIDGSWPQSAGTWAGDCDSGPVACPDGAGGVIVAIARKCGPYGSILLDHFTPSGGYAPGWSYEGRWACHSPGAVDAPGIVSDGRGGAIITWEDLGNGSFEQIYAQHLSADTSLTWGDRGIPVCTQPTSNAFTRSIRNGSGRHPNVRYSARRRRRRHRGLGRSSQR